MSCLRQKTKLSVPDNIPWKGLISTFQKKLNRLLKPKSSNRSTRTQYYHHHHHHHHHHYHHKHCYHNHSHQSLKPDRNSANLDDQDGLEDDNKYDEGDAKGEPGCVELNGVDASAEEFIDKMKRVWKLERQISDENYLQKWVHVYEH